jgi:hypothetical protein
VLARVNPVNGVGVKVGVEVLVGVNVRVGEAVDVWVDVGCSCAGEADETLLAFNENNRNTTIIRLVNLMALLNLIIRPSKFSLKECNRPLLMDSVYPPI